MDRIVCGTQVAEPPGTLDDAFRVWDEFAAAGGNLERRRRVEIMAAEVGVAPTTLALAWVLRTPPAIKPIIGPRTTDEVASSLAALDVALSDEQAAWLDLDDR